jgi:hypothetical protein
MDTRSTLVTLTKPRSKNRLPAFLFALFPTALLGCQTDAFEVTLDLPEQRQTAAPAGPISVFFPSGAGSDFVIPVNLADEAKNRGVNPPKNAFIRTLSFSITSTARPVGDIDTFDYLATVEVFLEPTLPGSQLQKLKVATVSAKPGPAGEMYPALVSNLDVFTYLKEGAKLKATATGNTPTDDVSYTGKLVLGVQVF